MNSLHLPRVFVALSSDLFDTFSMASVLPRLSNLAQVRRWEGPGNPGEDVMRWAVQENEILIIGWTTPSLIPLLEQWTPEKFPLQLVAHTGGTIKHLLPRKALENGLLSVNANAPMADTVAEFTLGAILAMRHRMFEAVRRYKSHLTGLAHTSIHELRGSQVGIIGASAIGKSVMELLRPFQVRISLYDPYCSHETAQSYGAELIGLKELFTQCDIISLHAPVTPETMGMLRADHFSAMKDGALFVNTARGRLVNHSDLLRELQTGRIFALLDVTDPQEPLPGDSPFFQLENCVLLPHIGAASEECRRRQGSLVVDEIVAYLKGESLRHHVSAQRWDTMA